MPPPTGDTPPSIHLGPRRRAQTPATTDPGGVAQVPLDSPPRRRPPPLDPHPPHGLSPKQILSSSPRSRSSTSATFFELQHVAHVRGAGAGAARSLPLFDATSPPVVASPLDSPPQPTAQGELPMLLLLPMLAA
nr:classical arabinogalactan protein 9-like [Lolium perenne]